MHANAIFIRVNEIYAWCGQLVGPDFRPMPWTVGAMEDLDGVPLLEPRTPQMRFRAKLPCRVPAYSFVRHAVELSAT